jgi:hypothetical protein
LAWRADSRDACARLSPIRRSTPQHAAPGEQCDRQAPVVSTPTQ